MLKCGRVHNLGRKCWIWLLHAYKPNKLEILSLWPRNDLLCGSSILWKNICCFSTNNATHSEVKTLHFLSVTGTHILGTHLPPTVCWTKSSFAALTSMAPFASWYSFYMSDKIKLIILIVTVLNASCKYLISFWQEYQNDKVWASN